MQFGYLNQNNPTTIGDTESQEIVNASIDKDFLEYSRFPYDSDEETGRKLFLPNGKEVIIDAEAPNPGTALWRNRGSDDEYSPFYVLWLDGMYPSFSIADKPATGTYFTPANAGEVFYCVTLYDKQEDIESVPYYSNEYHEELVTQNNVIFTESDIQAGKVVKVTLRRLTSDTRDASRYEYRVYRMPVGGTEYLLAGKIGFDKVSELDEFGHSYLRDFIDDIKEDSLSAYEPMTTEKLSYEPLLSNMSVLAYYADKLFIGGEVKTENAGQNKGILYFSATGTYWKFNASFFFSFVDPVIGITPFKEMLVVQTTRKLYIIYGDSEDNFVMKEIDSRFGGIAYNSGQPLSDFTYFLANAQGEGGGSTIKSVFAFNGNSVTDISQKINKEFPFGVKRTAVLGNRYFIIEKEDGTKLILDTVKVGWCKADDRQGYFSYRTKEFGGHGFLKQIRIASKGAVLVLLLGDDGKKVITQKRLYSTKRYDHYLYVSPRRFDSFSLRLIGWEGTEIYAWEVIE